MRRALLLALLASVVALIAIACGRTGAVQVSAAALRVRIQAPSLAVQECPYAADLQVVDAAGAPVSGVRTIDVLATIAFIGGTAQQSQLQTAADGSATVTLAIPSGASMPATDTLLARVAGATSSDGVSVDYQSNQTPFVVSATITTSGGVAVGGSAGTVSLGAAVTFDPGFADDLPVDATRIRWAADTSSLDPIVHGAGTSVTMSVPPGPHLVYASYLDCAGESVDVMFHVEGGTRVVDDKAGLKGAPTTIDAEIADPRRVWLGYPGSVLATASLQRYDEASGALTSFGPGAGGGGNSAQTSRVRRYDTGLDRAVGGWSAQGNIKNAIVYDGAPATPTAATTFNTGQNTILATVCTDDRAYFVRADQPRQVIFQQNVNTFSSDTGNDLTTLEAVWLTNGRCGIAMGDAANVSWLTASGSTFDGNFAFQQGVPSTVFAIGFTPSTIWYTTQEGLHRIGTDGNGDQLVIDNGGVPQDATFLPAGFDTTSIRRVVGGRYGGVETLWLASDNPGGGQPSVLRMVTLTPRDAVGDVDPSFLAPVPLLGNDPTVGVSAGDIAVPRDFAGTFRSVDSLWIGRSDTTAVRRVYWK